MKKIFGIVGGVAAAAAVFVAAVAVISTFGDAIRDFLISVREWMYTVKNLTVDYVRRFASAFSHDERNDFADV